VEDRDGELLRSGRLSSRNDIEIDGLFFRLTGVKMADTTLTLTFEDREIAVATYLQQADQAGTEYQPSQDHPSCVRAAVDS